MRILDSFRYLFKHLVSEFSKGISHIIDLLFDDLLQKRRQLGQCCVGHVVEPALNEDAVIRLKLEVFSHIIDDNSP